MSYNVKIKNLVNYHEPKDASELREQSATKAPAEHLQCTNIVGGGIVGDSPDGADVERPDIPNYATEAYERRIEIYRDQIKSGVQEIDADQPNLAQRCLDGINEIELEPPHPKGDPMDIRRENTWFNYKLREKVALTVAVSVTHGTVAGAGTYNYGDTCTLVLTPDTHYHATATSWSGLPASATISADFLTAEFEVKDNYSISITAIVNQYAVITTCTNGTIAGAGTYDYGTSITLEVTPDASYGMREACWTGLPTTGVTFSDSFKKATFSVDAAYTVSVACAHIYTLTFNASHGTISSTTLGAQTVSNSTLTFSGFEGDTVTVNDTADQYYEFTSWFDGTTPVPNPSISQTFTVGTSDKAYDCHNLAFLTFTGDPVSTKIAGIKTNDGHGGTMPWMRDEDEIKEIGSNKYYGWYNYDYEEWLYSENKDWDSVVVGDPLYYYDSSSMQYADSIFGIICPGFTSIECYKHSGVSELKISDDKITWSDWDGSSHSLANPVCYIQSKTSSTSILCINGEFKKVKGHAASLIDYDAADITAVTLNDSQFNDGNGLFSYASTLEDASEFILPWPNLTKYCYQSMFQNCSALKSIPSLSISSTADFCCSSMFSDCSALEDASSISITATSCEANAFSYMFQSCTFLTIAPSLTAIKSVGSSACECMFCNCTHLVNAPEFHFTSMAASSCRSMFSSCTSLLSVSSSSIADAPSDSACQDMFSGCTSLASVFEFSTTNYFNPGEHAYYGMFQSCIALDNITGSIKRTNKYCCQYMFLGCTSLKNIASGFLPTNVLWEYCYNGMFQGSGLETIPSGFLPATTLANSSGTAATYCYKEMFKDCTSLLSVPSDLLPATTLATGCYQYMFNGCELLENAPILPTTTNIGNNCYQYMFQNCHHLKGDVHIYAASPYTWGGTRLCKDMFTGAGDVAGYGGIIHIHGVYDSSCKHWDTYGCGAIQPRDGDAHWNVVYQVCPTLKFSKPGSTCHVEWTHISLNALKSMQVEYTTSTRNGVWDTAASTGGFVAETVYVRAKAGTNPIYDFGGDYTHISGPITALIDWEAADPSTLEISASQFHSVNAVSTKPEYSFVGTEIQSAASSQTTLKDASGLELSTNLKANAAGAYAYMFYGCTALTAPPTINAIPIRDNVFEGMFKRCSSLTTIPSGFLSASPLCSYCYDSMFRGCTSLTNIPSNLLPATSYASTSSSCYYSMFSGCTALTFENDTFDLPLTTLVGSIYSNMFQDCINLKGIVDIHAGDPGTAPGTIFTNAFLSAGTATGAGGTIKVDNDATKHDDWVAALSAGWAGSQWTITQR